jgi:hypothetical protein
MALRSLVPPLLVLVLLASAAPLLGATDGERNLPQAGHGRLQLVASKRGAILTGRNLAPGDRVAGGLMIRNTGALSGSLKLKAKVRGSRPMAAHLFLTVREQRRRGLKTVYSGSLARFRAVRLGTIRRGRARRFRFTVRFDPRAPNSLQGKRASATFTWRAVQAS